MRPLRSGFLAMFFMLGCAVLPVGWAEAQSPSGGQTMVAPGDLKWVDVPSLPPGAKMAVIEGVPKDPGPFTFRLKFPADYKVPVHTHPVVERVTVISGTFHLAIGDTFEPGKAKALTPGSVAIMTPGTPMYAFTKDETVVQLHGVGPWGITYAHPEEDPRKK